MNGNRSLNRIPASLPSNPSRFTESVNPLFRSTPISTSADAQSGERGRVCLGSKVYGLAQMIFAY